MSTYTYFDLAGWEFWGSQSRVFPILMTVFRESNRCEFSRMLSERNHLIWGTIEAEEDERENAVVYRCSVSQAIDRLNVMGFTLERAREEYEERRKDLIKDLLEKMEDEGTNTSSEEWDAKRVAALKTMTFDAYKSVLKSTILKVTQHIADSSEETDTLDKYDEFINGDHAGDYHMGFFCSDIRSLLRLACECVPGDADVTQDITDLIHAGYYDKDEEVCKDAIDFLLSDYSENAPYIILTEGITDQMFLQGAMRLLYPHLVDYYTFFDFQGKKSQGGAGPLVNLVKAFAAAGITNRIIVLFDNDTAAFDARKSLKNIHLPKNIVVINYPDRSELCSYPTLGSKGLKDLRNLDINGSAASLELYLGHDCLLTDDGSLCPVKWSGLSGEQGSLTNKAFVQSKFNDKLKNYEDDNTNEKAEYDWSGLRSILELVFKSFN